MAAGGHALATIGEEDDTGAPICAWCEDLHRRAKIPPCVHTFPLPRPDLAAEESDNSQAGKDTPAGIVAEDSAPVTEPSASAIRKPRAFFCASCQEMTRFMCDVCEIPEAERKRFQTQFFVDICVAKQKSSLMSCISQGCTLAATFACCDCQLLLCPRCRQSHDSIPATGGHLLLRLGRGGKLQATELDLPDPVDSAAEDLGRLSADRTAETCCPVHPENVMTLYCQPCKSPACTLCIEPSVSCRADTPHKDHLVVTVEAAADECRARASKLLQELNGALRAQMQELEGLELKEGALARRRQHYMDEGANVVSRITTSLHAAIGKMTRRINEVEATVLSQLHSKKMAVRLHHSMLVKMQGKLIHAVASEDSRRVLELVPGLEGRTRGYLADQTKQLQEAAGGESQVDAVVAFETELRTQLRTLEQTLETVTGLFFYEVGQKQPN